MTYSEHNDTDKAETNEELERFIYTISHDLRSPLTAIQGITQILNEDYEDILDDDGRYYLQRINVNIKKMESMINDLLKISRVGRISSPMEKLDVKSIVSNVMDEQSKEHDISDWTIAVSPDLPKVVYEKVALHDIFYNLIKNAMIFMGNQEKPRIEVGHEMHGSDVIFYVKDNGIGIERENLDKIFKVFERVRDIDSKGNGIGLALIKKIIEYYGGNIWVESVKGKGSTFFFSIPYKEAELNEI